MLVAGSLLHSANGANSERTMIGVGHVTGISLINAETIIESDDLIAFIKWTIIQSDIYSVMKMMIADTHRKISTTDSALHGPVSCFITLTSAPSVYC